MYTTKISLAWSYGHSIALCLCHIIWGLFLISFAYVETILEHCCFVLVSSYLAFVPDAYVEGRTQA